jgi:RHS repeat-associated protein
MGSCSDPASCKTTTSYLADHKTQVTVDRASRDTISSTISLASFGVPTEERTVRVVDGNAKNWDYSYDVLGNLLKFTAPLSQGNRSFTFKPNSFFPWTETSGPRGQTTVLTHNAIGQPQTQKDARGITTTFVYNDPLSRPTNTQYSTSTTSDVSRTYDKDLLNTISSTDGGTYTYTYDELNRVSGQQWVFGGVQYSTSYKFDHTGCLFEMTYPTQTVVRMTCDAKGRTTSIKMGMDTIASSVTYLPTGRPATMLYGNERTVTVTAEYGRIKSIVSPATTASPAAVENLTYTYDGASNVTSITDGVTPSKSVTLINYDNLDRLKDLTIGGHSTSFLYDELGNRKEKNDGPGAVTSYVYDSTTNRLATSNGPSIPKMLMLTWGPDEKLATSSDGSVYSYDGLGRRVSMRSTSVDVVYHYDSAGRLLAETTSNGVKIREYFYVADQLVAVDGCVSGFSTTCGEREWYHTDLVGTVVARTNRLGAISQASTGGYGAWGEIPVGASGTRLFNGRTFDSGTGFSDFGARVYSQELGRFISGDSVWAHPLAPQSANQYSFTLNNPYKFSDPSGNIPFFVVTGGIGALIGGVAAGIATYDSQKGGLAGINLMAVAAGAVVGGMVGMGVGEQAALALAGSHSASLGAVAQGGMVWLGDAVGTGLFSEVAVGGASRNAAGGATRATDPNRLNHIFGNAEHALDDFVAASGGREAAFTRIQAAANAALREGRLPVGPNGVLPSGDAGAIIDVAGTQIRLIGGRVVDGVVQIASASRRGLP